MKSNKCPECGSIYVGGPDSKHVQHCYDCGTNWNSKTGFVVNPNKIGEKEHCPECGSEVYTIFGVKHCRGEHHGEKGCTHYMNQEEDL